MSDIIAQTGAVHLDSASFATPKSAGDMPVMVDFTLIGGGPCKMAAPIVEEMAEEYEGKAVIAKVDVDTNNELAGRFGVIQASRLSSFSKNGEEVSAKQALQVSRIRITAFGAHGGKAMENVKLLLLWFWAGGVYRRRTRRELSSRLYSTAGYKAGGQLMWTTDVEKKTSRPLGKPDRNVCPREQAQRFAPPSWMSLSRRSTFPPDHSKFGPPCPWHRSRVSQFQIWGRICCIFSSSDAGEPAALADSIIITTGGFNYDQRARRAKAIRQRRAPVLSVMRLFTVIKDTIVMGGGDSAMEDIVGTNQVCQICDGCSSTRVSSAPARWCRKRVLANEKKFLSAGTPRSKKNLGWGSWLVWLWVLPIQILAKLWKNQCRSTVFCRHWSSASASQLFKQGWPWIHMGTLSPDKVCQN